MTSVFKDLGIYGISEINETAFLAGMLLGEPVMLIGRPGTAKTELVKMMGSALREHSKRLSPSNPNNWFNYQIYDASKLNFEDLVGFPDPTKLKEGKVGFIDSPQTIWNKNMVCFDESNRCVKERQSNLFEIIRNRKCNGLPTGIQFIFGTMNPYGDAGTQEMSSALVDRHNLFLYFDDFHNMSDDDKSDIIQRIGASENIGGRFWGDTSYTYDSVDDYSIENNSFHNETLAESGKNIALLMKEASNIYNRLSVDMKESISMLVSRVSDTLISTLKSDNPNFDISGRRAGMMFRNILAARAIELAKSSVMDNYDPPNLKKSVNQIIKRTLPINIAKTAKKDFISRAFETVESSVDSYWKVVETSDGKSVDTIYQLFNSKNALKKLDILISEDLDSLTNKTIWHELYEEDQTVSNIIKSIFDTFPELVPEHMHEALSTYNASLLEGKEIEIPSIIERYSGHQLSVLFKEAEKKKETAINIAIVEGLSYIENVLSSEDEKETLFSYLELKDLIETIGNKFKQVRKSLNNPVEESPKEEEKLENNVHP